MTAVSANYLAYASVLRESLVAHEPDFSFRVLIVDRATPEIRSAVAASGLESTFAEDLGLEDFEVIAFKYDVVELNTALKPTFMKRQFEAGFDSVVYLDPDIRLFAPLTPVWKALDQAEIVLIPHALAPALDGLRPSDIDFLRSGAYNLGFIALKGGSESAAMLDWWESRCLSYGFNDLGFGTFVDQKWIDLAPSFFGSVEILRDRTCNVAYWNLHERQVEHDGSAYIVDGAPLTFFHFSGVKAQAPDQLSRHQTRHQLVAGTALATMVGEYCAALLRFGHLRYNAFDYTYATFNNGQTLTRSMRRAVCIEPNEKNPFDAAGRLYKRLNKARWFQSKTSPSASSSQNTLNFDADDRRVTWVNRLVRGAAAALGPDRVDTLLRYAAFLSRESNFSRVVLEEPFEMQHRPRTVFEAREVAWHVVSAFSIVLSLGLAILFAGEYRLYTLKAGKSIDLWSLTTFISIVVPILIVGPFAADAPNYLTIGDAVDGVVTEMNHGFAICAIGAFSWWLGAVAHRHTRRRSAICLSNAVARFSVHLARLFSPVNLWLLLLFSIVSGMAIILLFGSTDKSLRDYMLENASVRPFFNLSIISIAPLAFLLAYARFLDTRNRLYLIASLATASICLLSGARSIFFTPIVWLYLAYRAKNPGGNVAYLVVSGAVLGALAMFISVLRAGGTVDDLWLVLRYGALYGNSFSDFRDFCWYLSATHDAGAYMGATYLSGLMSFVPTYLSPFREQFNLGVITATAVGLSPLEHAGIRITAFGELYINFGLAGVAVGAFLISWSIKIFDDTMRRFGPAMSHVALVMCIEFAQVPLVLLSSNSIWSLYSFGAIAVLFKLILFVFPPLSTRRKSLPIHFTT